jgi:hypothetical protein
MTGPERKRLKELLLRAASSFEEGLSVVNISLLVENRVVFAENHKLHEAIGHAIRYFVADAMQEKS